MIRILLLFILSQLTHAQQIEAWIVDSFASSYHFSSSITGREEQICLRYGQHLNQHVDWIFELDPVSIVSYPSHRAFGVGGSPLGLELSIRRFFVTSSGGFLYFNRQLFGATQMNFTAEFGGGIKVHHFDLGYIYHHISNANLGRTNPGMDVHCLFVGYRIRGR